MAVINFARREIEAKIVYYGPAMSGKTTNVQVLHGLVPDKQRGELHSMATAEERTLFFDYIPVQLGQVAGFNAKFKLFTVPGQVFYKETRRVVLQGADAVVFVADSSPDRAEANLDALIDLEENLRSHGLDLASIPLVLQFNKRDADGARPVVDMQTDLNPFGVPAVEAVACEGRGVMDTLRAITDLAAQRIRDNLAGRETAVALTAIEKAEGESDQNVIREHLERIKRVRPIEEQRGQKLKSGGHVKAADVDAFLLANVERAGEFLAQDSATPSSATPSSATPSSATPSSATPSSATASSVAPSVAQPSGTAPPSAPPRSTSGVPSASKPATPATPPPAASGVPAAPPASAVAAQAPPKITTAAMVAAQLQKSGARNLPPPPPVPTEARREALPPAGPAIEATIDPAVWGASRLQRVLGARIDAGNVRVDLVLDEAGEARLRPVMLVLKAAEAPPPAGPGWMSVIGASVIFGSLGTLVGIGVGILVLRS